MNAFLMSEKQSEDCYRDNYFTCSASFEGELGEDDC